VSNDNATLSEICTRITDGTHYSPKDEREGKAFIRVKDITAEGIDFEGCFHIGDEAFEQVRAAGSVPVAGDILFSKDGTVGKVAVVPDGAEFGVLSSIAILQPKHDSVDSRYLAQVLKSPATLAEALGKKTGSALRRLILKDLKGIRVPLPSLEEQRRIADLLDEADRLQRLRKEANEKAQRILPALFEKMFGDPVRNEKGWLTSRLRGCTAQVQIGPFGSLLHQADYVHGGIALINPKHIRAGRLAPTDSETITPQKHSELHNYHLRQGDVVMGRRGEMGRCAVVEVEHDGLLCGTGSLVIRADERVTTPRFLCAMLSHNSMKVRLESLSLGQTLPNLNASIVEGLVVAVPPIELQRQFSLLAESANAIEDNLGTATDALSSLSEALRSRLFGEAV
jgi:type I restriction enzyme S subunit